MTKTATKAPVIQRANYRVTFSGEDRAAAIASALVHESIYFIMEPLPCDQWEVQVHADQANNLHKVLLEHPNTQPPCCGDCGCEMEWEGKGKPNFADDSDPDWNCVNPACDRNC